MSGETETPGPEFAEPASAGQLFDRFGRRLIHLARLHLDTRLHHRIDPEDVVQSVYKSFLLRYNDVSLEQQEGGGLWRLLTVITLRKCADRVRYHRAECRDISREARPPTGDDQAAPEIQAVGREPTPEDAAVLAETVERVLLGLEPGERPIIELSLQGYSTQEISERLGAPSAQYAVCASEFEDSWSGFKRKMYQPN